MHIFCLFLLFIQAVSSLISNVWSRNLDLTRYTIFPTSPANAVLNAQTETLLKTLDSNAEVIPKQSSCGTTVWFIKSNNANLKDVLSAIEGVNLVEQEASSTLSRRDVPKYIASAKESSNIKETEEFLDSKVQGGTEYRRFLDDDGTTVLGWDGLALDEEAAKAVEEYEGIEYSLGIQEYTHNRVLPSVLSARAGTWRKQENADEVLVRDSQYKDADLSKLSDFVHISNPGENTFIYIIEEGVNLKVQNPDGNQEFNSDKDASGKDKILQTKMSKDDGKKPEDDDDAGSHGTMVASKAAGRRYGLAKEAKIIPVKIALNVREFKNAIDLIAEDLESNPDRQHRSAVVMSMSFEYFVGQAKCRVARNSRLNKKQYGDPIKKLLGYGVPLILSAGNKAEDAGRKEIDTVPQIFNDVNAPIINVGAADYDGKRADFSQYVQYLTIYAPGVDIEGQTKVDKEAKDPSEDGTSFAAPQVAGMLATYMASPTKPWDDSFTGIDRVKKSSSSSLPIRQAGREHKESE